VRSVIEDGYPSLVLQKEVEDFVTNELHTSNKHLSNPYNHWGFSHVDY